MRTVILAALALGAPPPLAAQSHSHAAGAAMEGGGVDIGGLAVEPLAADSDER